MSDTVAARLGGDATARLAALGVATIDGGLTDDEFARIEAAFGFEFADDHRAFLAAGLRQVARLAKRRPQKPAQAFEVPRSTESSSMSSGAISGVTGGGRGRPG